MVVKVEEPTQDLLAKKIQEKIDELDKAPCPKDAKLEPSPPNCRNGKGRATYSGRRRMRVRLLHLPLAKRGRNHQAAVAAVAQTGTGPAAAAQSQPLLLLLVKRKWN